MLKKLALTVVAAAALVGFGVAQAADVAADAAKTEVKTDKVEKQEVSKVEAAKEVKAEAAKDAAK